MGQYYKPISLTKERNVSGWVYSHSIKHWFTRSDGQKFLMGEGLKLMEHSWMKNRFVQTVENLLIPGGPWHKTSIVWAGDYGEKEYGKSENFYGLATDELKLKIPGKTINKKWRYIVNHLRKEFVDKTHVPTVDGWAVHPLPLLTAEGNGQGGGDYRGKDPKNIIGSWAHDIISIESTPPNDYKEFIFDLKPD